MELYRAIASANDQNASPPCGEMTCAAAIVEIHITRILQYIRSSDAASFLVSVKKKIRIRVIYYIIIIIFYYSQWTTTTIFWIIPTSARRQIIVYNDNNIMLNVINLNYFRYDITTTSVV